MRLSDEDFVKMCKEINPSAGFDNHQKNLQIINDKLKQEENVFMFKNRRVKKSVVVAVAAVATLSLSAVAFGANVVNYFSFRSLNLGEHARFINVDWDTDIAVEEREMREAEMQALIDGGYLIISNSNEAPEFSFLTFDDVAEGIAHFVTDVKLPTHLPAGFELKNVFFFVETLEDLQEHGANKFMGWTFSNGEHEIRAQVRYMTEETGFISGGSPNMQVTQINGHDAVVHDGVVDILIGDVMYMFFGTLNVDTDDLIAMAASLQ